ncbi:50S ribosomal protein L35 [Patescibacteria group bacterium]|nr:50S ribosomal protein L35 [Patescibacteria group bacterium]
MSGKTNKSITKRFRLTKKGKLMRRPQNQDHLNSKQSGNQRRKKKGLKIVKGKIAKDLIKFL